VSVEIEEVFTVFGKTFTLMAIIYFQEMHDTFHIHGSYYKKLTLKLKSGSIIMGNKKKGKKHLVCNSSRFKFAN